MNHFEQMSTYVDVNRFRLQRLVGHLASLPETAPQRITVCQSAPDAPYELTSGEPPAEAGDDDERAYMMKAVVALASMRTDGVKTRATIYEVAVQAAMAQQEGRNLAVFEAPTYQQAEWDNFSLALPEDAAPDSSLEATIVSLRGTDDRLTQEFNVEYNDGQVVDSLTLVALDGLVRHVAASIEPVHDETVESCIEFFGPDSADFHHVTLLLTGEWGEAPAEQAFDDFQLDYLLRHGADGLGAPVWEMLRQRMQGQRANQQLGLSRVDALPSSERLDRFERLVGLR